MRRTVVNGLFVMAHSFDEKFAVRQCDVFLLTEIIVGQQFSPPEKRDNRYTNYGGSFIKLEIFIGLFINS